MFNEKLDLYVCQRDENGKMRVIREFDTFNDFFRYYHREENIRELLVNDPDVRVEGYHCRQYWEFPGTTCYGNVLYDKYDHLYSVERLVGMFREWRSIRRYNWMSSRHGRTNSAWGRLRHMRTTQEIRQSCAVTEDEKEVNALPRPRRGHHNLPTLWDDKWVKAQKSWKWQSKRRHQWKPK